MEFKELYSKYKIKAFEILKNLISYKTILTDYNPDSDAPFGEENKKALEYLLDLAKNDGFIVKNIDNYAGHIEYGTGKEILGVLAHLDVVPVKEEEWVSSPFTLDIRDGKLFGRGSMDDKGPLVCAYTALKMLKDRSFKPKRRIRLIVGCDEESGSRCLEHYLKKEPKPSLGFSPDAEFPVIYGEKGMLSYDILSSSGDNVIAEFKCGDRYNIVPSYAEMKLKLNLEKEYLEFLTKKNYKGEIKNGVYMAYGFAAHAMCPRKGLNAAYILFEFLVEYTNSKLAEFMKEYLLFDTTGSKIGYAAYDEEMGELTSNYAIVRVDDSSIRLGVNCRVPYNECFSLIEEKLNIATAKYAYNYKILGTSPRHFVDKSSELVSKLMKAYTDVTNDFENKPFTIGGGTYAREIGNAVAFGPQFYGREDVCHIANEYMYIEDFDKAVEIYYNAIYELTK
ncbi:MAG: dipeptidase PepV [Anaeroplasma sp.]